MASHFGSPLPAQPPQQGLAVIDVPLVVCICANIGAVTDAAAPPQQPQPLLLPPLAIIARLGGDEDGAGDPVAIGGDDPPLGATV